MSEKDTYSFSEPREPVSLDPSTLNLNELALVMAMAGWSVVTGHQEDGSIDFSMQSLGGDGSRSADELVDELGLRDEEGAVREGYSVSGSGEGLVLRFQGMPDEMFSATAQKLCSFSPWT